MKYWENGFYLEQNTDKTRKEISDEYWLELLQGQNNGLKIEENEQGIPVLKPNEITERELAQNEHYSLVEWFDVEYARKEQKLRRLHTLGKITDMGANPYDELIKLYNEAETKRARIQELERLLSDSSK